MYNFSKEDYWSFVCDSIQCVFIIDELSSLMNPTCNNSPFSLVPSSFKDA
ncbi:10234_t:CDS:2 [Funneliformis geosporum]|uniref:10234_t:CDS:1 n=1 Tax=Funneliformis geosporum TaxID=1117311 RepID=A0A9W4SH32_9GLOM|nr:10234_t:CDS:2 [Funneliformis geosporum]